jgi:hypothetical protein
LASLFCVGFSSGAKADSVSKWTATWNLSNHQSVNYTLNPGTSVFRGWTLNINGPMTKGQVYYIKNSPALLSNNQNEGTSYSVHDVWANFSGFYWWVEGDRFFYYADKDCDWVRVYVSYNQYNNTNKIWSSNNTPSSYTVPINLSDIPPNLDADSAQDILTALNNINNSVSTADKEARKRLEAINNSINNNYNDLTRPSDSAVNSASGTLSDTSDVTVKTGLFTSIDNLTQGVFNLFSNPGSTTLTFPGFGMEINGVSYDVWADTAYNLSDVDDKFGGLMSVVRFATSLLVYLALIRSLFSILFRKRTGKVVRFSVWLELFLNYQGNR